MFKLLPIFLLALTLNLNAQDIEKPRGCFAGTNGTNPAVLAHSDVRGVLLMETWANIETSPGVFDFTALNAKISTVKAEGLRYSLAIAGGAFGSPSWLIDSLNVPYQSFTYQNQTWRLPKWWNFQCKLRLDQLIEELGNQYASDTMLSHVYVTQMTSNGVEGHLNGVDMTQFYSGGFTNSKWISAAKTTAKWFADAFPDKPIVFEVHEIDNDTLVPATIINDLYNDASLCNRVGLGMWWISGKTSYQTDLVDFIMDFPGDKYAQVIGRSDQLHRFQDSLYETVFTQAKDLNIRYIEPWPFEFQYHTYDSLMQDFNTWADANFSSTDSCPEFLATPNDEDQLNELKLYPNPSSGVVYLSIDVPYKEIELKLYDLEGRCLLTAKNQTQLDLTSLPIGMYTIRVRGDQLYHNEKIMRIE